MLDNDPWRITVNYAKDLSDTGINTDKAIS